MKLSMFGKNWAENRESGAEESFGNRGFEAEEEARSGLTKLSAIWSCGFFSSGASEKQVT